MHPQLTLQLSDKFYLHHWITVLHNDEMIYEIYHILIDSIAKATNYLICYVQFC